MFRCKIVCMTTLRTFPFIGRSIDDIPDGFALKLRRVAQPVHGNSGIDAGNVPCRIYTLSPPNKSLPLKPLKHS